jgi:hypothetical protein
LRDLLVEWDIGGLALGWAGRRRLERRRCRLRCRRRRSDASREQAFELLWRGEQRPLLCQHDINKRLLKPSDN